jgi:ribulose-5-phosphate 4-epimerase/fuculose-1-phosphate aldolase
MVDTIHAWRLIQQFIQNLGCSWIQGPGGNVSIKVGNTLYIKPSGYRIDQINEIEGLAQVDIQKFKQSWPNIAQSQTDEKEKLYSQKLQESSLLSGQAGTTTACKLRPSMETGFHVLLNHKYVVHVHSLRSILLADYYWNNPEDLKKELSIALSVPVNLIHVLEPVMPGARLTQVISDHPEAKVILLKNHGLILSTDDIGFLNQYLKAEDELFEKVFGHKEIVWPKNEFDGEFRPLFPDAIILEARIKKFIIENKSVEKSTRISLSPEIKNQDLDAYENWLAIQGLLLTQPKIKNLPPEITNHVALLPTEIERKKAMGKQP